MKYLPLVLLLSSCCVAQSLQHNPIYQRRVPGILPQEYAARRASVLKKLPPHSVAIFRSAEEYPRTGSAEFVFRQSNNLLYLSGYTGQNGTLVLSSDGLDIAGKEDHTILFVPIRNKQSERWLGPQMGPDEADSALGITSLPNDSLDSCLAKAFASTEILYYDWQHPVVHEALPIKDLFAEHDEKAELQSKFPSIKDVNPTSSLVDSLRMIKSPAEIALMEKAIDASCEGHRKVMREAAPSWYEYQIAAVFDETIEVNGCEAQAYPDIVGSGPNSCYLHYSKDRRQIQLGDIVLMDCGGEYSGYAADITRTFPINGVFSPEQRAIYDIVYNAQTAGIAEVKPGAAFNAPHKRAFAIIHAGLAKLGIISDSSWATIDPLTIPLDSIKTGGAVPDVYRYFMHGTSHPLGLDVHDPNVMKTLAPNEVLTVEPGIYIPEGSPCDKKWWNIGVRIEDDILVTETGSRNLSAGAPRAAEDIEALMKK